jgi:hypothetical protein
MPLGTVPVERSIKRRKSTSYRMDMHPNDYAAFINAILNGSSFEAAGWNANTNPALIKTWLERGEILDDCDDFPQNSQAWQYVRFFRDYKKAVAQMEILHVCNINVASQKSTPHNWTASAWMLERKRPHEFSQKYIIEKITDQKVLDVIKFLFENATEATREELASLVQLLPSLKLSDAA